uniref:Uncharacterized protein n=1 Tax=Sphaerodactylus townsendi TaxID=933632 RepID=A0ACB8FFI6_9SAUR
MSHFLQFPIGWNDDFSLTFRTSCCRTGPVLMCCTRSFRLFSGTLAEQGAAARPANVTLEEEELDQWDLPSVVYMMDSALSMVDFVEDNGFFHFLNNFSAMMREIKSVLSLAPQWKVGEVIDKAKKTLRPIRATMARFAPKKVADTLLAMKDFLEGVVGFNWGGAECLKHLATFHEHLEKLKPGKHRSCLKGLHRLLVVQGQELAWLANHPLIEEKLGRQNVFARLTFIKRHLEVILARDIFLRGMQAMLDELDKLKAVNPHE